MNTTQRKARSVTAAITLIGSLVTGANAAVSVTDVAIIGNYMDGNSNGAATGDAFSWVVLNDINAGEVLYFSDSSYISSSNSFIAEGLVQYTVPTGGLSIGTIMNFASGALPSGYVHLPNTAYSDANMPSLTPSSAGDQLVMFQDDNISDTAGFAGLFAVNNSSTGWGYDGSSATSSDLYPGMTNAVNALGLGASAGLSDEFDNVRYVGPTTGTSSELYASIQNLSNWERTNDSNADPVAWVTNGQSSFTVVPEPSSALLLGLGSLSLMFRRSHR